MRVGHVSVGVTERFVMMRVAVRPGRHRVVPVQVVAVVVAMGVFMVRRRVLVCMGVPLEQVQQHTGQHQGGARPTRRPPPRPQARMCP